MMAERLDNSAGKWAGRLAWLIAGWIACSYHYGTLHLTETAKKAPILAAEAGCEHWLAETNKKLALQPEVVDPKQIPKDRCPHPDK